MEGTSYHLALAHEGAGRAFLPAIIDLPQGATKYIGRSPLLPPTADENATSVVIAPTLPDTPKACESLLSRTHATLEIGFDGAPLIRMLGTRHVHHVR
jgi:hypothetical protein